MANILRINFRLSLSTNRINTYVQEVNLIKFITALIITFICHIQERMYATEIEIVAAQQLHTHILQVRLITTAGNPYTTLFHRLQTPLVTFSTVINTTHP